MIQSLDENDKYKGTEKKGAYFTINRYTYSTEVLHPVAPPSDAISAKPKAGGPPILISNFGQFINPEPTPGGKRKSRRLRKKSKNTKRKLVRTRGRR